MIGYFLCNWRRAHLWVKISDMIQELGKKTKNCLKAIDKLFWMVYIINNNNNNCY